MDQEVAEMKRQWLAQAEAAFEQLLLDDQGNRRSFDQLEKRAVAVSRQFGSSLLTQQLQREARLLQEKTACPRCGRAARRTDRPPEPRTVETRTGPVSFERSQYRCAHCRIRFFPRGRTSEIGR